MQTLTPSFVKFAIAGALAMALAISAFAALGGGSSKPTPTASAAAVDMFLKIDGIDGESQDHAHEGEIDVLSWSWGMSQSAPIMSRGGGAGKVNVQDLTISKRIDKATPKLADACATGKHMKEAVLTVHEEGRHPYQVVFSNVVCSSFEQGGNRNEAKDTVSLSFADFKVKFLDGSDTDIRPH
jgi:type VI secretion system secreted protein Hcp